MYVPTQAQGLILAFVSTACWGTWGNFMMAAGGSRFEVFYMDFVIGMMVCAVAAAAALGEVEAGSSDGSADLNTTNKVFTDELPGDWDRVLYAASAGFIFNTSNILLCNGITIAGLSIAFPLGVGTALALGTALTYISDTEGDPAMLFPGVCLGFLAVLMVAVSHRLKDKDRIVLRMQTGEKYTTFGSDSEAETEVTRLPADLPPQHAASNKRSIIICLTAGVLMSTWSPLLVQSQDDNGLSPYAALLWFQPGVFFSTIFVLYPLSLHPLTKDPPLHLFSSYASSPTATHLLGLLAGFLWQVGTTCNILGGAVLGFAVSYAIGQSAPMVASLWGVVLWREFRHTTFCTRFALCAVFALYGGAITLISLSK